MPSINSMLYPSRYELWAAHMTLFFDGTISGAFIVNDDCIDGLER
ncbi:MAG: hypothetical protein WAX23_12280 [Methanosarcina sp.]